MGNLRKFKHQNQNIFHDHSTWRRMKMALELSMNRHFIAGLILYNRINDFRNRLNTNFYRIMRHLNRNLTEINMFDMYVKKYCSDST